MSEEIRSALLQSVCHARSQSSSASSIGFESSSLPMFITSTCTIGEGSSGKVSQISSIFPNISLPTCNYKARQSEFNIDKNIISPPTDYKASNNSCSSSTNLSLDHTVIFDGNNLSLGMILTMSVMNPIDKPYEPRPIHPSIEKKNDSFSSMINYQYNHNVNHVDDHKNKGNTTVYNNSPYLRRMKIWISTILLFQYLFLFNGVVGKNIASQYNATKFSEQFLQTCSEMHNVSPLPIQMSKTNRTTLVILIGSLRGGEAAWRSLYRNVLDMNNADLALFVGEKKGLKNVYPNNSTLYKRAKFRWEFKEPEGDWSTELYQMFDDIKADDPTLVNVDMIKRFRTIQRVSENHTGLFGPIGGKKGSGAIIFIIRHWLSKKIKELNLVNVYNRFVITRADHYYKCAHDLSTLDNDRLWVPIGENYKGVTDRHLIVNNRLVFKALDIFPSIFRDPHSFIPMLPRMNPERLIDAVWRQHCLLPSYVKLFPRMMFTCGSSGDETRWRKYGRMITMNNDTIRLKYANEYKLSNVTCLKYDALVKFNEQSVKACTEMNDVSPLPIQMSTNNNRTTLVILIGSLRGGEAAWRSLYRNVLDINNADLALFIGEKKGLKNVYPNNSTLYKRAKFRWEFKEPEGDWSNELYQMFDDIKVEHPTLQNVDMIQNFRTLQGITENRTGLFGPVGGKAGSGAIIFVIRHWLSKKIKELNLVNVYDRFVITRADHYYKCAHDLSTLDNDRLWVPIGENYQGMTGRHLIVNNRLVLKALDIFPTLFRDINSYIPMLPKMNSEQLIDAVWRQHCLLPTYVNRFQRIMFTCGSSGDETRWRQYGRMITINNDTISLKYESEYDRSFETCSKYEAVV